MSFLRPELFLLAIPLGWLLWKFSLSFGSTFWLRALLSALLLTALAGPYAKGETQGRDLVVLVDRSRSMPTGTLGAVIEFLDLSQGAMEAGDRFPSSPSEQKRPLNGHPAWAQTSAVSKEI